uniref:uncharacterized protein C1orf112 homolog isoform X2 n=1 Tax=Ciona intestinalis TaxID=7719 RepID=UPI000EF4E9ED|nr:uncharacterized protein C1orf112 homolog isoform X2 [Ciona intestinalis]|eukprot:XP_026694683.1 uncharacterized protein C1orf112 homolog isoform X2 [Ciona intestinalis]
MSQKSTCGLSVSETVENLNDFAKLCLQENVDYESFNLTLCLQPAKELPLHIIKTSSFQETAYGFYQDLETVFQCFLKSLNKQLIEGTLKVELLKNCVNVVDVFYLFLKTLVGLQEGVSPLGLPHYNCIPIVTLDLLKASYQHCKNSESAYGNNFSIATELLQSLYQKTFMVQKLFSIFLNKLFLDQNVESKPEELEVYQNVCIKLLNLTSVVDEMDCNLVAVTWKILLSFATKFQPCLKSLDQVELIVDKLVCGLKHHIKNAAGVALQAINENTTKEFTVSCRMACFFIEGLTKLIQLYDPNQTMVARLTELVYCVFEDTLPILSTKEGEVEKLNPKLQNLVSFHFMGEMEKFLTFFVDCDLFRNQVLCQASTTEPLPKLLLLLNLVRPINCSQHVLSWFESTNEKLSIIQTFFDIIPQVYTELCILSIHVNKDTLPLYEVVASRVSACVLASPSFHQVEIELLNNLLCPHPYKSMLAADVWCFLARLIPPDESFQQFKALVLLLKNLPHYCATKAPLFVLVGRLFSFLLPHHQEAIVSTYSMKSNFALWESLSSSGHQFSAPIMIDSCQTCVTLIDGWVGNGGCLGDSCDVVSCLNITHNLLQSSNITDELHKNLSLKQSLSLLNETLQSLWLVLPTYIQVGEAMTELLKHLLRVSTSFIKWMFNFNLSLVTCKVLTYLQNHPNAVLTCEVAKFLVTLESLGSKMVGNETKIKLWKQVICDATKNWLSQHKVFNEMELFSRLTRNPSNINLICAGSNNLELLKSHLQRTFYRLFCV